MSKSAFRKPSNETYFGDGVIDAGFLPVPHLLIRHYITIGLNEELLVFVQQLMAMRWDLAERPEDLGDIAKRMGKNLNTVRRYSHKLRELGLLEVRERFQRGAQISNAYNLGPLWRRLRKLAPEGLPETDLDISLGAFLPASGEEDPADDDLPPPTELYASPPIQNGMGGLINSYALPPTESYGVPHTELRGVKGIKNDQEDQEALTAAVAAFETYKTIFSVADAELVLAKYPAAIPHAAELVAKSSAAGIRDRAAYAIALLERGWTPPAGPARSCSQSNEPETNSEFVPLWERVIKAVDATDNDRATWLKPTKLFDIADGIAVVATPNVFVRNEIRERFAEPLALALAAELDRNVELEIVIESTA